MITFDQIDKMAKVAATAFGQCPKKDVRFIFATRPMPSGPDTRFIEVYPPVYSTERYPSFVVGCHFDGAQFAPTFFEGMWPRYGEFRDSPAAALRDAITAWVGEGQKL